MCLGITSKNRPAMDGNFLLARRSLISLLNWSLATSSLPCVPIYPRRSCTGMADGCSQRFVSRSLAHAPIVSARQRQCGFTPTELTSISKERVLLVHPERNSNGHKAPQTNGQRTHRPPQWPVSCREQVFVPRMFGSRVVLAPFPWQSTWLAT